MTKAERRLVRKQMGSQQAVAELLGLNKRTILRYEQARTAPRWYELALAGLANRIGLADGPLWIQAPRSKKPRD